MNTDYCEIACVIDRSGSMSGRVDDVIGGFNTFLEEQKKLPGRALLTLVQFDDQYELHCSGAPIRSVAPLTTSTYVPRGSTALNDAVGRTINNLGARLAAMREDARPGRVIVVIITDGQENASKEFTRREQIREMIEHQRSKYSWEFVFLGAGVDAFEEARTFGIDLRAVGRFENTQKGIRRSYAALNATVTSYRGTGVVAPIQSDSCA